MQILLLSLLTVYSVSALPSKGKNKSKKKQEKHRGTKQQTKELIQYVKTHGPADPTRPSQLYTPGSLCKETDAAYIGSKMNYPRCKRKRKTIVATYYGILDKDLALYEFSHLIPLEIGGSNDLSNVFPGLRTNENFIEYKKRGHAIYKGLQKGTFDFKVGVDTMFDDINDLWATNYSFESMTNAAKGIKSHSANLPAKKGGKNKIDEKSLAKLLSKSMTIESDGDEPFANSANIMIPVENIGYQALLRTRKWAPGGSLGGRTVGITKPITVRFRHPDFKGGIGFKGKFIKKGGGREKRTKSELKPIEFVPEGYETDGADSGYETDEEAVVVEVTDLPRQDVCETKELEMMDEDSLASGSDASGSYDEPKNNFMILEYESDSEKHSSDESI